jgi:superfamily II DNA or RNA helicase
MLQLRPYQADLIADTRRALRHHRRVLLQLPTGGGKTVISATMMGNAASRGMRSWFVVHRRELIDQTSRTLEAVGVPHGFIAAGMPPRYREPVTLCSVQTLRSRAERLIEHYGAPDLVVWDESHHCAAGTWGKVAALLPNAFHVGLTATPERLDGKGLDGMFRALVPGPSVRWLIEQGYLAKYRVWTHTPPDLSGVRTRGADYDPAALGAVMSDRFLLGDCVQHYLDICGGKQAIAFCVSVEHAIATRDAFRAAGVVAEELDGGADGRTRREVIKAFREGKIKVLTSVDLFGEGFDLPELTAAILLRPTKSLGLHLQQVGRALRTSPGKDFAIILDHAGNIAEHGLPDEEREWSLQGRSRRARKGSEPVKTCGNCFGTAPAAALTCPYCGQAFAGLPREVEQVDGKLVEIDVEAFKRQARKEVGQAKTREELERVARERGYKKAWVDHIMKARGAKVGAH